MRVTIGQEINKDKKALEENEIRVRKWRHLILSSQEHRMFFSLLCFRLVHFNLFQIWSYICPWAILITIEILLICYMIWELLTWAAVMFLKNHACFSRPASLLTPEAYFLAGTQVIEYLHSIPVFGNVFFFIFQRSPDYFVLLLLILLSLLCTQYNLHYFQRNTNIN